jgi:hypothetical protein
MYVDNELNSDLHTAHKFENGIIYLERFFEKLARAVSDVLKFGTHSKERTSNAT